MFSPPIFQTNDETQEMDKLNNVMKRLETSDSPSEVDKINDLIKVRFVIAIKCLLFLTHFFSLTHREACNAVD